MRLRAVIFDDEPLMSPLVQAVLKRPEYEIFTFCDPGFCPLHVADHCPCPAGALCADVIISDLKMPMVNGLDFLQTLMEKGCRRPQFAITSRSWTEAEVERARQLGCKVFTKPFYISDIIQWLGEVEPLIRRDRQLTNSHRLRWLAKGAGLSGERFPQRSVHHKIRKRLRFFLNRFRGFLQETRDEGQKFLLRTEMNGLAGCHVFHSSFKRVSL